MGSSTHVTRIYLHGITPIRPDSRYRFADVQRPVEFFLEEGRPQARYALTAAHMEAQDEPQNLLLLSVHDLDPVGHAGNLPKWTYLETYDVEGEIHHVWWLLVEATVR